jgi:hypothetical protein
MSALKQENPERVREADRLRQKRYYDRNREAKLARQADWRKRNPEVWAKSVSDYNARNPGVSVFRASIRRSAKLNAIPQWADLDAIAGMYELAAVFKRCGLNLHVDHVVPLNSDVVCGLHWEENLQLMHANENLAKSNKLTEVA